MNLRHVVVVGHGHAPAIAAVALRRAFGRGGLKVTWVETPGQASAHEVLASLPNLQVFHQLLGLDAASVMQAASGTFTLGRQYVGFAGEGSEFLHGYGPIGRPIAGLPFLQFWLKARAAGMPAALGDFSREVAAARNGRVRVRDGQDGFATAHGYHLDARGYSAMLRRHAEGQGVTITVDAAPVAVVADGRVTALRLTDGREVAADLFIDTTAGASIRGALDDGGPVEAAVSGCTRLLRGSGRALAPLPLYSRAAAHRAGWSALYPLRDRTGIVVAYDEDVMSDEAAAETVPVAFDSGWEVAPLASFTLRRPWGGNVVAIGDAAGQGEPVSATGLHRLQVAVTHLISLFPVSVERMPEAGIYNEELDGWQSRLRDFDMVPFALNRREGEPFWDAARSRPVSAELEARVALFAARGMVAQYNQDSFAGDEWQGCFIGMGIAPRGWDPQADHADEQRVMADFRAQLMDIRADVTAMDTHEHALARMTGR